MKQFLHLVLVATVLNVGCTTMPPSTQGAELAAEPDVRMSANANFSMHPEEIIQDKNGAAVLQKVEFRRGVSSATVERLALRHGCTSEQGAGLVTEKGPVEVYRMQCNNGTTFMAQCELRQCRPMH